MINWDSEMFPLMTDEQLSFVRSVLLYDKPKKDDFYMNLWWIGCARQLVKEYKTRTKNFSNI